MVMMDSHVEPSQGPVNMRGLRQVYGSFSLLPTTTTTTIIYGE